jgi:ferredoxin-fold anticodon binding domain-containing protein
MDISKEAQRYIHDEVELCNDIIESVDDDRSTRQELKRLYGVPDDSKTIYCASGSFDHNVSVLGPDKTFVIPVFPYRKKENLEKEVSSIPKLIRESVDSKRILPVIQHPEYYTDLPHFQPIFSSVRPPCYFIRGQYAYSILLDLDPEMVESSMGTPLLADTYRLRQECLDKHESQIEQVFDHESCWEYRWRQQARRDDDFYNRLQNSLAYRYASVSLCIGQKAVDDVLEIFDPVPAWRLLLYLHIIFDHVITHGFGSDYAVSPLTNEGSDFYRLKNQISFGLRHSFHKVRTKLPSEVDSYIDEFLRENHFLVDFDINNLEPENIQEKRKKVDARIKKYKKNVKKIENKQEMITRVLSISFLATGAQQVAANQAVEGFLTMATGSDEITKLPSWISSHVINALKKIQRKSLGTYLIDTVS